MAFLPQFVAVVEKHYQKESYITPIEALYHPLCFSYLPQFVAVVEHPLVESAHVIIDRYNISFPRQHLRKGV